MMTKKDGAALLRAAATQTISEKEFWEKFDRSGIPAEDPVFRLAYEAALHFWGNFHERNLLLIKTKPNKHELEQGKNELNLIAEAIENNWTAPDLKRRLENL